MTTRTLIPLVISAALLTATGLSHRALAAETFKIDPAHAVAIFRAMHLGYAHVFGRFNDISGEIELDRDNLTRSTVKVRIQTASVDTNHLKRDDHLRSPDFFNAKEFPEMTFVSDKIVQTSDNTGTLHGHLTLLGITKRVTLDVTLNKIAPNPLPGYNNVLTAGLSGRTTIKRSDFGMNYALQGIGDEIDIWLEFEAQKQ